MKRMLVVSLVLSIALAPVCAAAHAPASQRIGGARIAALAARAIRALPVTADRSYVAAFSVPDQIVAAGRVTLAAGAPLIAPSYVNVPVSIEVNGTFERTVYAGYRVQRYVETAVAARDLAPGTVLSSGDVKMERVPYAGQAVNGTAILLGREVDATVAKGQPIALASTVTNMIVRAGSTVVLIVHDSGVQLTADVVARTSGGLGDQVQIYDPSTNKSLSGTVIGPGRVELDLSGGDDAQ